MADIFLSLGQSKIGYDFCASRAIFVSYPTQDRRRVLAAWVCLVAAGLLYGPLAGAAWASRAMVCCARDHCNIPKHHHQKTGESPASTADCGHDMSGLTDCSMSCCENPDRPVVTAVAFVPPPLAFASAPLRVACAIDTPHSIEIPRSVQPLLHPPRIAGAAL
jgi:hypothetical protein